MFYAKNRFVMFSTKYFIDRYNEKLGNVEKAGVKKSFTSAVCVGVYHCVNGCSLAITFW